MIWDTLLSPALSSPKREERGKKAAVRGSTKMSRLRRCESAEIFDTIMCRPYRPEDFCSRFLGLRCASAQALTFRAFGPGMNEKSRVEDRGWRMATKRVQSEHGAQTGAISNFHRAAAVFIVGSCTGGRSHW